MKNRVYSTAALTFMIISIILAKQGTTFAMETNKKAKEAPAIKKDYRVNYINGIEKEPKGKHFKVIAHQSGELWLTEQNVEDFAEDLNLLRSAMRKKRPIEIRYSVETHEIDFVNGATIDWIPYVQDINAAGDYIDVVVLMMPSLLRLYKNHPRFKVLYDRLLKAQAGYKECVSLEKGLKAIIAHDGFNLFDVLLLEE